MTAAIAEPHKVDFQKTVAELLDHDIGCRLLALATGSQLKELADDIAAQDLYRFPSVIRAAAGRLNLERDLDEFVREHLEYLLWVQHRSAFWRSGRVTSAESMGCRFHVEGEENLKMSNRFPTVVITPMTLAYEDALWVARFALGAREIAIYGEGVTEDAVFERVARMSDMENVHLATTPREILEILNKDGVFLTYPDFVYAGHQVRYAEFMGMSWPFSSAFIKISARANTVLLPAYTRREGDDITICFEEAVQLSMPEDLHVDRRWEQSLVAATVAGLLENMILRNPVQWQLLTALVAECSQRGY